MSFPDSSLVIIPMVLERGWDSAVKIKEMHSLPVTSKYKKWAVGEFIEG
jgi:hypothetical protein